VKIKGTRSLSNKTARGNNEYAFTHVFNESSNNKECFERICTPLIDNVIDGHNAVLIAYGQTGSGKTHSLVGKPHNNVLGLLPRTLHRLFEIASVTKIELSVTEAYGVHVARIEIFDLFSETSHGDWDKKSGKGAFQMKNCTKRVVASPEDCADLIDEAHSHSHFACTAKNPESSRGHTVFTIKVTQESEDGMDARTSFFIIVDLAGSEGESAITKEFIRKNNPTTVMIRRLEAGCINAGLCQLQLIFGELKKRGHLSKVVGNGLRRMLHPFINTNTHISVLFTVAPTTVNSTITESTLKFAVQAGMVKVTPVAAKSKKNIAKLLKKLEATVEEQANIITTQEDQLEEKDQEIAEMLNQIDHLENEIANASIPIATDGVKKPHSRGSSLSTPTVNKHRKVPTKDATDELFSLLKADLAVLAEEEGIPDEEEEVKEEEAFGKVELDAPVNDDEEEKDSEEEVEAEDALGALPNAAESRRIQHLKSEDEVDREIARRTKARNSIRFEANLAKHLYASLNNTPETPRKEQSVTEIADQLMAEGDETEIIEGVEEDDVLNFEGLENHSNQELIDRLESLQSMLADRDVIIEQYKAQQVVMMDHLAETNENLYHFFKIKYKVPGEKKKRETGIYTS